MANQTVSPHEAEIARNLLREMDAAERPGGPAYRDEVYERVDSFLFSVERSGSGVTVRYSGDSRDANGDFKKGLLGAMLREALKQNPAQLAGEKHLLDD